MTIRRLNCSGASDGVKLGSSSTMTDSYIHDLGTSSESHNDGVELGAKNVQLIHNTILNARSQTAAVFIGASAPSTNILVEDVDAPVREGDAVEYQRFNLHASVRIAAEDDRGRERLCRYGARPPFSLARLRVLRGGLVAYRIKNLGAGRAKHRVMTPLELLARLSALVPPPRYPLVRYHGVLAPRSSWRREIVPRRPTDSNASTGSVGAAAKKGSCNSSSHEEPAAADTAGASGARALRADEDGRPVAGASSRTAPLRDGWRRGRRLRRVRSGSPRCG